MKKNVLTSLFLLISFFSQAQWVDPGNDGTGSVYYSNGNVGIGISNPTTKLHIQDNLATGWLQNVKGGATSIDQIIGIKLSAGFSSDYAKWSGIATVVESTYANNTGLALYANETEYMRIRRDGNVGIGTSRPTSKLHIQDNLATGWFQNIKGGATSINQIIGIKLSAGFSSEYGKWSGIATVVESTYANNTGLALYANELEKVRISANGNVGIGTTTPDSKLAVNGTIHSKEVKVDLVGWPDYVFAPAYKLPTLEEVQQHIHKKGHLPNMPSAEEVAKNGVNLGEITAKLLEKIEELTMYIIEQEARLNEQKKETKKLINRIEKLEE